MTQITTAATSARRMRPIQRKPTIRKQPLLPYRVMSYPEMSREAANMVLDLARTGRGTVLTPGCNTPVLMYRNLVKRAREVNLRALLRGEKGDFHMGMIDGTEAPYEHRSSFVDYFVRNFLCDIWGDDSLYNTKDPAKRACELLDIDWEFPNVYIPWMPKDFHPIDRFHEVLSFSIWLLKRSPIDLIICGIGPDGHIAFLNGQNHKSKINPYPYSSFLAARVKLWDGIRGWKWGDSDGACACTKESCSIQKETPEYALTIIY